MVQSGILSEIDLSGGPSGNQEKLTFLPTAVQITERVFDAAGNVTSTVTHDYSSVTREGS